MKSNKPGIGRTKEFIDALHDFVQVPGWYMMRDTNPQMRRVKSISECFSDNKIDIGKVFEKYYLSSDSIKENCDERVKEVINSEAWQTEAKKLIDSCGQFAGELHLLLGKFD